MTFANIPSGAAVFLDANTIVYHLASDPTFGPACLQLIERIFRKEIQGYTSTHVLADVAHRLMTLEAAATFAWPNAGVTRRLRKHPAEVQKLVQFHQSLLEIPNLGIQILPVVADLVYSAAALSRQFGLLTGDALIVAIMQSEGLIHLASNDADFDRVPGLTRYAPA